MIRPPFWTIPWEQWSPKQVWISPFPSLSAVCLCPFVPPTSEAGVSEMLLIHSHQVVGMFPSPCLLSGWPGALGGTHPPILSLLFLAVRSKSGSGAPTCSLEHAVLWKPHREISWKLGTAVVMDRGRQDWREGDMLLWLYGKGMSTKSAGQDFYFVWELKNSTCFCSCSMVCLLQWRVVRLGARVWTV